MNALMVFTLINIPKVNRKTINYLLNVTDISSLDENDMLSAFTQAKATNKRIAIPTVESIRTARNKAEEIINETKKQGIGIMTILDEDFPERLKEINAPPVLLFYKGNKECLSEKKSVGIIGTRTPTPKGKEIAEKLGSFFAAENFVVVSGLAKGCDEAGHKGCVEGKGRSIAVLPCELNTIYPSSNKKLAEQILQNGGCLISEYPIDTKPNKNYYIQRDRLESALSEALVVVETATSGGTMHTVGFAREQNKLIACYKHSSEYLNCKEIEGNQVLIKEEKAIGIYSQNDVLNLKKLILDRIMNKEHKEEDKEVIIQTSMF